MALVLVTIDSRSVACAHPVQSGILTCRVVAGFGRIIGSVRAMSCRFERGDGVVEDYDRRLGKIGLDFGYLSSFVVVVWAGSDFEHQSRLGEYWKEVTMARTFKPRRSSA